MKKKLSEMIIYSFYKKEFQFNIWDNDDYTR